MVWQEDFMFQAASSNTEKIWAVVFTRQEEDNVFNWSMCVFMELVVRDVEEAKRVDPWVSLKYD